MMHRVLKEPSLIKTQEMTLPYLISGAQVDEFTENVLEKRLFALSQDTDLLGLKDIIRESYQLANFAKVEHDLMTQ